MNSSAVQIVGKPCWVQIPDDISLTSRDPVSMLPEYTEGRSPRAKPEHLLLTFVRGGGSFSKQKTRRFGICWQRYPKAERLREPHLKLYRRHTTLTHVSHCI